MALFTLKVVYKHVNVKCWVKLFKKNFVGQNTAHETDKSSDLSLHKLYTLPIIRRNPIENRAISGFSGQKSVPE